MVSGYLKNWLHWQIEQETKAETLVIAITSISSAKIETKYLGAL